MIEMDSMAAKVEVQNAHDNPPEPSDNHNNMSVDDNDQAANNEPEQSLKEDNRMAIEDEENQVPDRLDIACPHAPTVDADLEPVDMDIDNTVETHFNDMSSNTIYEEGQSHLSQEHTDDAEASAQALETHNEAAQTPQLPNTDAENGERAAVAIKLQPSLVIVEKDGNAPVPVNNRWVPIHMIQRDQRTRDIERREDTRCITENIIALFNRQRLLQAQVVTAQQEPIPPQQEQDNKRSRLSARNTKRKIKREWTSSPQTSLAQPTAMYRNSVELKPRETEKRDEELRRDSAGPATGSVTRTLSVEATSQEMYHEEFYSEDPVMENDMGQDAGDFYAEEPNRDSVKRPTKWNAYGSLGTNQNPGQTTPMDTSPRGRPATSRGRGRPRTKSASHPDTIFFRGGGRRSGSLRGGRARTTSSRGALRGRVSRNRGKNQSNAQQKSGAQAGHHFCSVANIDDNARQDTIFFRGGGRRSGSLRGGRARTTSSRGALRGRVSRNRGKNQSNAQQNSGAQAGHHFCSVANIDDNARQGDQEFEYFRNFRNSRHVEEFCDSSSAAGPDYLSTRLYGDLDDDNAMDGVNYSAVTTNDTGAMTINNNAPGIASTAEYVDDESRIQVRAIAGHAGRMESDNMQSSPEDSFMEGVHSCAHSTFVEEIEAPSVIKDRRYFGHLSERRSASSGIGSFSLTQPQPDPPRRESPAMGQPQSGPSGMGFFATSRAQTVPSLFDTYPSMSGHYSQTSHMGQGYGYHAQESQRSSFGMGSYAQSTSVIGSYEGQHGLLGMGMYSHSSTGFGSFERQEGPMGMDFQNQVNQLDYSTEEFQPGWPEPISYPFSPQCGMPGLGSYALSERRAGPLGMGSHSMPQPGPSGMGLFSHSEPQQGLSENGFFNKSSGSSANVSVITMGPRTLAPPHARTLNPNMSHRRDESPHVRKRRPSQRLYVPPACRNSGIGIGARRPTLPCRGSTSETQIYPSGSVVGRMRTFSDNADQDQQLMPPPDRLPLYRRRKRDHSEQQSPPETADDETTRRRLIASVFQPVPSQSECPIWFQPMQAEGQAFQLEPDDYELTQPTESEDSELTQPTEPEDSELIQPTEPDDSELTQPTEPNSQDMFQLSELEDIKYKIEDDDVKLFKYEIKCEEDELTQSTEPDSQNMSPLSELEDVKYKIEDDDLMAFKYEIKHEEDELTQPTEPEDSELTQPTEPEDSELTQSTEPDSQNMSPLSELEDIKYKIEDDDLMAFKYEIKYEEDELTQPTEPEDSELTQSTEPDSQNMSPLSELEDIKYKIEDDDLMAFKYEIKYEEDELTQPTEPEDSELTQSTEPDSQNMFPLSELEDIKYKIEDDDVKPFKYDEPNNNELTPSVEPEDQPEFQLLKPEEIKLEPIENELDLEEHELAYPIRPEGRMSNELELEQHVLEPVQNALEHENYDYYPEQHELAQQEELVPHNWYLFMQPEAEQPGSNESYQDVTTNHTIPQVIAQETSFNEFKAKQFEAHYRLANSYPTLYALWFKQMLSEHFQNCMSPRHVPPDINLMESEHLSRYRNVHRSNGRFRNISHRDHPYLPELNEAHVRPGQESIREMPMYPQRVWNLFSNIRPDAAYDPPFYPNEEVSARREEEGEADKVLREEREELHTPPNLPMEDIPEEEEDTIEVYKTSEEETLQVEIIPEGEEQYLNVSSDIYTELSTRRLISPTSPQSSPNVSDEYYQDTPPPSLPSLYQCCTRLGRLATPAQYNLDIIRPNHNLMNECLARQTQTLAPAEFNPDITEPTIAELVEIFSEMAQIRPAIRTEDSQPTTSSSPRQPNPSLSSQYYPEVTLASMTSAWQNHTSPSQPRPAIPAGNDQEVPQPNPSAQIKEYSKMPIIKTAVTSQYCPDVFLASMTSASQHHAKETQPMPSATSQNCPQVTQASMTSPSQYYARPSQTIPEAPADNDPEITQPSPFSLVEHYSETALIDPAATNHPEFIPTSLSSFNQYNAGMIQPRSPMSFHYHPNLTQPNMISANQYHTRTSQSMPAAASQYYPEVIQPSTTSLLEQYSKSAQTAIPVHYHRVLVPPSRIPPTYFHPATQLYRPRHFEYFHNHVLDSRLALPVPGQYDMRVASSIDQQFNVPVDRHECRSGRGRGRQIQ